MNARFESSFKAKFNSMLADDSFILGEAVAQFEKEFANYVGVNHCVGVASGLDALLLALKVLKLPAKSEVIVPSNTYIATIMAITQAGLVPVLVEPDSTTYNITASGIEQKISTHTRCIMVVHLYGKVAPMDEIMKLAKAKSLFVIEDAAQAHGATYKGRQAGSFGDLAAFSFYPTKNLGALGDAGAVVTNSDTWALSIRTLRNYGSRVKYHNEIPGYNSRLDTLQAGFLSIKLKELDLMNNHKRKLAEIYFEALGTAYQLPCKTLDGKDNFHLFVIRHPRRDDLKHFLLKKNILSEIHYPIPPHKQLAFKGIFRDAYPIAEAIHSTCLSLPLSFAHTRQQILRVAETLNEYAKEYS